MIKVLSKAIIFITTFHKHFIKVSEKFKFHKSQAKIFPNFFIHLCSLACLRLRIADTQASLREEINWKLYGQGARTTEFL
jgi:hypothetical protein